MSVVPAPPQDSTAPGKVLAGEVWRAQGAPLPAGMGCATNAANQQLISCTHLCRQSWGPRAQGQGPADSVSGESSHGEMGSTPGLFGKDPDPGSLHSPPKDPLLRPSRED